MKAKKQAGVKKQAEIPQSSGQTAGRAGHWVNANEAMWQGMSGNGPV